MKKKEKEKQVYNLFAFLRDKENRPIPLELDVKHNKDAYKGLKVVKNLFVSNLTKRTIPPNLLVVDSIYDPQGLIRQIPKNLRVGGDLDLGSKEPLKIPDDLRVDGDINLGVIPASYPKSLENKISINGFNIKTVKALNKLEDVSMKNGDTGLIRGKGFIFPYSEVNKFYEATKKIIPRDEIFMVKNTLQILPQLSKVLDIKFENIGVSTNLSSYDLDLRIGAIGKSNNKSIGLKKDYRGTYLISEQGSIVNIEKYLNYVGEYDTQKLDHLSPAVINTIKEKLFNPPKLKGGVVKLPLDKTASLTIPGTRMFRSGKGILDDFSNAIKYVPSPKSQENLKEVEKLLGIKWDKLLVYAKKSGYATKGYEVLFTAVSKPKKGKIITYDRGGLGPGGYSKVYSSGGSKIKASQVLNGVWEFEDFK